MTFDPAGDDWTYLYFGIDVWIFVWLQGELDSRMLSILLMGVNRAFPYGKDKLGEDLSQHLDTMHRVVHLSPFNVALHALCLLYQVAEASSAVGDRYTEVAPNTFIINS